MSIKGPAYTKTTWAFQERPVASSKFNTWDDRIEAALEILFQLHAQARGGGDGILRDSDAALEAAATDPPSLAVEVQPGQAFISGFPCSLPATLSPALVPPLSFPRIDLLQVVLATGNIAIKTGTESSSPAVPLPDADCLALAAIHLRPGMSSIQNEDDSANGYLEDIRTFL